MKSELIQLAATVEHTIRALSNIEVAIRNVPSPAERREVKTLAFDLSQLARARGRKIFRRCQNQRNLRRLQLSLRRSWYFEMNSHR